MASAPAPHASDPTASPGPRIELTSVSRRFDAVLAVDGVSITLAPGEIHAVIGENGAGKSTLMKLAAGSLAPTAGSVAIEGRSLEPATPAEAIRRGVGMVHQHFMLVGAFRAIENLVLGAEPTRAGGRLDLARAEARARVLMEEAGLLVPLGRITDELTVGERQRLEILRVLFRGARALLLDEPTAVLSPIEATELYGTLRRLADGGATIAVVTHRLDEVVRFADRVTVMRRGKAVLSGRDLDEDALTRAIMGAEPPPAFHPPARDEAAPPVLDVEDLRLVDAGGRTRLDGVSFTVRSGEIVGVAGVEGNGQRELVRALAGLEPRAAGTVLVAGRALDRDGVSLPARSRRAHLAVVLEDRHAEGLLLDATVADNLVLGDVGDPRDGPLDERAMVARRIARFHVDPPDPARLARELSGGNQQKIVVARALDRVAGRGAEAALVLAQPTRGVDVGAAATIHEAIGEAARAGLAVLVVSADLGELRRLSHRILVMHRGRIVADRPAGASDEEIGRLMLGTEAA